MRCPARPAAVPVEVQRAVSDASAPGEKTLALWAERVMARMNDVAARTDVCVRIVGEKESRTLNREYRGIDRPTNVLSFPADLTLPDGKGKILGDIVICDPVVIREAQAQGKPAGEHYAHMVVHGMLHLYGYDHVDPVEADVMEDIEREILGRLGIADPYRAA